MATDTFDIQELVNKSGFPRRTIYFYIQQGLIPPPQGAGLAAFYTDEHLLRLSLIPILRRQGLRLDLIRERLATMDLEEMRLLIDTEQAQAVKPTKSVVIADVHDDLRFPSSGQSTPGWGEEHYIYYNLPGGIKIISPEKMSPSDRRRINQLLQAARQIFFSQGPQYVYNGPENDGSISGG